jgi:replicative DNA helicase
MKKETKKITVSRQGDRFLIASDKTEGKPENKIVLSWLNVISHFIKEIEDIPQAPEIEVAVLGAIMIEKTAMDDANNMLTPETFYLKEHRIIYESMKALYSAGQPIDTVTLYEDLKRRNLIDEVGGAVYLSGVSQNISSAANIEHHCKILLEKWMLRKILSMSEEFLQRSVEGQEDAFDILQQVSEKVYEIENNVTASSTTARNLWDEYPRLIEQVNDKYTGKIKPGFMCPSFPSLNHATGGIMNDLIVIYGEEKQGKTTLTEAIALDFALSGIPVGAITMEMDFDTYSYKALSMKGGIEYLKLRNPKGNNLDPQEFQRFQVRAQKFEKAKVYIDDKIFTFDRIVSTLKLWKRKYKIGLGVIDYLGLINSIKRHERRDLELAYFTGRFKALSKELQMPIIIVSQANSDNKTADSKGALRDCDFAISVRKPLENGIKSVKNKYGREFYFKDNHFLATIERSRHGKNLQDFVCGYTAMQDFLEIDIDRDIDDLNEIDLTKPRSEQYQLNDWHEKEEDYI